MEFLLFVWSLLFVREAIGRFIWNEFTTVEAWTSSSTSQYLVLLQCCYQQQRRGFFKSSGGRRRYADNRLTLLSMKSTDNQSNKKVVDTMSGTSNEETSNSNKKKANKPPSFEIQTRNPFRLLVLRLGLTEPAYTSSFNYGSSYKDGQFSCAYCGQLLFLGNAKYESGSGWPSFWRTANSDSIQYKPDFTGRIECQCKRCSSHLGHVFMDGPRPSQVPSDLVTSSPSSDPRGSTTSSNLPRYCMNGAALSFKKI